MKFDVNKFIDNKIIKRNKSLFHEDLKKNEHILKNEINEKSVLVIGGAGTIGSNYIKALLKFSPKKLIVVDINENGLTELTRDIRSSNNLNVPNDFRTYPFDFSDEIFFKLLNNEGSFDIVANFAAHKHVRSEKDFYSISSMVKNNVFNADKLLQNLKDKQIKHFFCVSTDKAANPVNLMGATKRLMEDVIFSYSNFFKVTTARFANVAFSNGSLLDGFIYRISKNQPLSAPKDIRRYFVSPKESGELCLLACIVGKNLEIFFPKISEVKALSFSEISDEFLKELGYIPKKNKTEIDAKKSSKNLRHQRTFEYPVYYFNSDTSGEKNIEVFYSNDEKISLDKFLSLGVIHKKKICYDKMKNNLSLLQKNLDVNFISKPKIISHLKQIVSNFDHIETGKNLDSKM